MALITIPNTFTVGATIVASQHNSNFSTIASDYNGNITDANIASNAAIADSKLAQVITAGKVSGAALTSLGSIPTGAGTIPAKNGGTGGDMSAATVGADPYFSATGVMSALAAGTSGQVKVSQAGAAPIWANALSSVLDYGTSSTTSTARQATAIKMAYGQVTLTSQTTQTITNLPFTSTTSYTVQVTTSSFPQQGIFTAFAVKNSGSQITIYTNDNHTDDICWLCIGT